LLINALRLKSINNSTSTLVSHLSNLLSAAKQIVNLFIRLTSQFALYFTLSTHAHMHMLIPFYGSSVQCSVQCTRESRLTPISVRLQTTCRPLTVTTVMRLLWSCDMLYQPHLTVIKWLSKRCYYAWVVLLMSLFSSLCCISFFFNFYSTVDVFILSLLFSGPDPTHGKSRKFDPTQLNPTQPMDGPNQPMSNSGFS